MRFGLSEEQRLLQSTLTRLLEEHAPLDAVRDAAQSGDVAPAALRDALTEVGLPGLLVPHNHGGLGLSMLDAALIAEALGQAVAPAPFVAPWVMAPVAIRLGASPEQAHDWLPAIADGTMRIACGVSEHVGSRSGGISHSPSSGLSGEALFVLDPVGSTDYLISDRDGGLHRVAADAPNVDTTLLTTVDRTRSYALVTFDDVAAETLPNANADVIRETIHAGRIAIAADTLGAAQAMLDKSVAYALEREQFGRVIGSFQAVKHLCAEMAAALEPCRAMVWHAAHTYDTVPEEGPLLSCHVKAHLGEVGKMVARTATEVHGGMGFTDLLGLHYWFKRIGVNRQTLGTPERAREDAARLQGWVA